MRRKILSIVGLTVVLSVAAAMQGFAGQWYSNANGWWWQNDDGTYPANTWQWIDGNRDGSSECYYFNPEGYCIIGGVTPDGYTVNEAGAWTVNGIVQTQQTAASQLSSSSKSAEARKLLNKMPYYGDPEQCTMTAEQARAYVQLLKDGRDGKLPIPSGYSQPLSKKVYWNKPFKVQGYGGVYQTDRNAVILGDFASDGNPFIYAGSSRIRMDASFVVYGWTNNTVKLAANEEAYEGRAYPYLFEDTDGTVKMYEGGSNGAASYSEEVLAFSNGTVGTKYYLDVDYDTYTYRENGQLMDFTAEKEAYINEKSRLAYNKENHSHQLSTSCFYQIKPFTVEKMIRYLERYAQLIEQ